MKELADRIISHGAGDLKAQHEKVKVQMEELEGIRDSLLLEDKVSNSKSIFDIVLENSRQCGKSCGHDFSNYQAIMEGK